MASLNNIVRVDIALNSTAVQRGTFGIPLIAAPLASFAERVRVYSSIDAAQQDNLPPELLTALRNTFSQTPRPSQVKVGRLSVSKVAFAPSEALPSTSYSLVIDGQPISFVSSSSPTLATIATGIADAITAASITGISAVAAANTVEVTFGSVVLPITNFVNISWGVSTPSATSGIVAADLAAINGEDKNWYGLAMVERTKQRVIDAAAWIETQDKLFFTATNETAVLNPSDATDLLSVLKNTRYLRTAVIFHTLADSEYPDAALMGRVFTIQPGGETFALKGLNGITPSNLTDTQAQTIRNKGGNTFEFYQPQIALTNPGKTAAGEWIDVIRFRDYLRDLIQTNLVMMMINRDKVPYTDEGLQLIGSNIRGSLRRGQEVGGIAPDELDAMGKPVPGFVLTIPLAADVDAVTKASRVAYFEFKARLAGAIHAVEITGSLAYEIN